MPVRAPGGRRGSPGSSTCRTCVPPDRALPRPAPTGRLWSALAAADLLRPLAAIPPLPGVTFRATVVRLGAEPVAFVVFSCEEAALVVGNGAAAAGARGKPRQDGVDDSPPPGTQPLEERSEPIHTRTLSFMRVAGDRSRRTRFGRIEVK